MPSTKIKPGNYLDTESNETTHFSVVDSQWEYCLINLYIKFKFWIGSCYQGNWDLDE